MTAREAGEIGERECRRGRRTRRRDRRCSDDRRCSVGEIAHTLAGDTGLGSGAQIAFSRKNAVRRRITHPACTHERRW